MPAYCAGVVLGSVIQWVRLFARNWRRRCDQIRATPATLSNARDDGSGTVAVGVHTAQLVESRVESKVVGIE